MRNSALETHLQDAWRNWHTGWDDEDIPQHTNPSFERGYWAATELLLPLLAAGQDPQRLTDAQRQTIQELLKP